MWFAVDPLTGVKHQALNLDGAQKICPSSSGSTIFIGRTGRNTNNCGPVCFFNYIRTSLIKIPIGQSIVI